MDFVDYINNFCFDSNEILVSFDVVSLFTRVPVDKAIGLVLELLSSDEPFSSCFSLVISDMIHGLELCF